MPKNKALVGNAADPSQVRKAKCDEEFLRDQELSDMRDILRNKEGRRYLLRTLKRCHVYKTSFTGNSTTFFNEGKRDIGLRILADITEGSPDLYAVMMQEGQEEGVKL
jgi:hypothetical protein